MNRFFQAFANLFRIEDLRNRLFFTLGLLAVYRIGAHIPKPGINTSALADLFKASAGSVLGIFDLFSGGNFRRLTIFALGIMPYITASIILQLMQVVFPYLERLQKEGELGRRKITQYTRYLTIVLSIIQSTTIASTLQSQSFGGQSLVYQGMNVVGAAGFIVNGWWHRAVPSATLNVIWLLIGAFAMWRILKKRGSSTSAM